MKKREITRDRVDMRFSTPYTESRKGKLRSAKQWQGRYGVNKAGATK